MLSTAESNAGAQHSSSAYAKGLGWAAIGLAVASSLAYKMVNSSNWTYPGVRKAFPRLRWLTSLLPCSLGGRLPREAR